MSSASPNKLLEEVGIAHLANPSILFSRGGGMFKEFKEFAMRGNVLDMAIGIILGAAFGQVVNSMVADILMPPLGLVLGKVDFSSLFLSLTGKSFDSLAAAKAAGAPTINYGLFVNHIINFVIIAFAIFIIVRGVNRARKTEPPAPPPPNSKACPYCAMDVPIAAKKCGHCTSALSAA